MTASSRYQADIAVEGGRIVQIGGDMASDRVIDATDRLVLPGGLDMHVHLTSVANDEVEFRWVDDFASGTRAAAAGGVTTVGNMAFPLPGESPMQHPPSSGKTSAPASLTVLKNQYGDLHFST